MNLLTRRSFIWVTLNLVGMLTFLRLAAELWVLPGEEGLQGGPGDPFYWFFLLVPFQLIFLVVNFYVLYVIVKHRSERSIKKRVCLWMAVAILWIIVAAYDHHRGFREIAPINPSMPAADLQV